MAEFKEELVINALHTDKAIAGKKYWCATTLYDLKQYVTNDVQSAAKELVKTLGLKPYPFETDEDTYSLLYPYEEPPKKRMTNRMLAEWLAKGNGQLECGIGSGINTTYYYLEHEEDDTIPEDIYIRPFGTSEWIEPTVDIYERDCKTPKIYIDKGL